MLLITTRFPHNDLRDVCGCFLSLFRSKVAYFLRLLGILPKKKTSVITRHVVEGIVKINVNVLTQGVGAPVSKKKSCAKT